MTDYVANGVAALGQSAPTFFIGLLLMYVCGYRLGWSPLSGYGDGFWDRLHHLVLPASTLALIGCAYYTRLVRGEMLETLGEDYMRTAQAKGLPERTVLFTSLAIVVANLLVDVCYVWLNPRVRL